MDSPRIYPAEATVELVLRLTVTRCSQWEDAEILRLCGVSKGMSDDVKRSPWWGVKRLCIDTDSTAWSAERIRRLNGFLFNTPTGRVSAVHIGRLFVVVTALAERVVQRVLDSRAAEQRVSVDVLWVASSCSETFASCVPQDGLDNLSRALSASLFPLSVKELVIHSRRPYSWGGGRRLPLDTPRRRLDLTAFSAITSLTVVDLYAYDAAPVQNAATGDARGPSDTAWKKTHTLVNARSLTRLRVPVLDPYWFFLEDNRGTLAELDGFVYERYRDLYAFVSQDLARWRRLCIMLQSPTPDIETEGAYHLRFLESQLRMPNLELASVCGAHPHAVHASTFPAVRSAAETAGVAGVAGVKNAWRAWFTCMTQALLSQPRVGKVVYYEPSGLAKDAILAADVEPGKELVAFVHEYHASESC